MFASSPDAVDIGSAPNRKIPFCNGSSCLQTDTVCIAS